MRLVNRFLIVALIVLASASTVLGGSMNYVYTIEVETYGPLKKSEQAATVELTWPLGSKTLTLPGRRSSETAVIKWATPRARRGVKMRILAFHLDVRAAKPGYQSWEGSFTPGDFVRTKKNTFHRIDKIQLEMVNTNITSQQRDELSLALPCGLDVYSTQQFGDTNRDGSLDATLYLKTSDLGRYRGVNRSRSQSAYAEIRHMSLLKAKWQCVFLANHRGIFIDGKQVEGCPPAPYGYSISGGYRADGMQVYDDFCPIDARGCRVHDAPVQSFVWRKGARSFEIVEFDKSNPLPLIERLKDRCISIRMRAATTLGLSGEKRAIEPLIEALSDENPFVRLQAADALTRLTKQGFGQDQTKWRTWYKKSQQKNAPDKK